MDVSSSYILNECKVFVLMFLKKALKRFLLNIKIIKLSTCENAPHRSSKERRDRFK